MSAPIISRDELKNKLDGNQDILLVDVLDTDSYLTKHIKGAVHVDGLRDDFVQAVQEKAGDANKEIIVYCASPECLASRSAAAALVQAGFPNVKEYEGGLTDWAEAGYQMAGSSIKE